MPIKLGKKSFKKMKGFPGYSVGKNQLPMQGTQV